MRSLFYAIPSRFRRLSLLVGLILLTLIACIPIALPFGPGATPQANAAVAASSLGSQNTSLPTSTVKPKPNASSTPSTVTPTPKGSSTPSTQPVVPSQRTATPTKTSTSVPSPTVPPKPTAPPAPTPTPTPPPAPGWKPFMQQYDPYCNNPAGTVWGVPSYQATGLTCTSYGTLVRQATSTRFAEVDLNAVNGTAAYGQNPFRLQLQIAFPAPIDGETSAAIILRTAGSGCGGFIFTLAPSGHWQLQEIITCTDIPAVASGTAGINPSQLTTVTIQGQNQTLSISINGGMVLSPRGNGATVLDGTVGLMVERPGGTSSLVQYSNLELDSWH